MKQRTWHLWTVAVVLAVASGVYQRRTGPTYPVRGGVTVGGEAISFRLPRSHAGAGDARIAVKAADARVSGTYDWRRYRSHDDWQTVPLLRDGDELVGALPHQPPAGKVMYRIRLEREGASPVALTDEPVVLRFRGDVPAGVVLPHILLVFAGMMLSTRTGLEAWRRGSRVGVLTVWTIGTLALGGLVFGPIMQKCAFGEFWTGWPRGHDLTDNKLAGVVLVWLIAAALLRWRPRVGRGSVVTAAAVTLAAWLIPHSVLGSELDYTKLEAETPATQAAELGTSRPAEEGR
jgi:hypothetical protein